jgi:hypothetical protein
VYFGVTTDSCIDIDTNLVDNQWRYDLDEERNTASVPGAVSVPILAQAPLPKASKIVLQYSDFLHYSTLYDVAQFCMRMIQRGGL